MTLSTPRPNLPRVLVEHGLTASMSRHGNCWDNAVVESFFHALITQHVHHQRYRAREEARQGIFEGIEVCYNVSPPALDPRLSLPAEFEAFATDSGKITTGSTSTPHPSPLHVRA